MKKGCVCRFYADRHTSLTEYHPDIEVLNRVISKWWREQIVFAGIVHSHPNGYSGLSASDMAYAKAIREANSLKALWFGVGAVSSKKNMEIVFYDCMRDDFPITLINLK